MGVHDTGSVSRKIVGGTTCRTERVRKSRIHQNRELIWKNSNPHDSAYSSRPRLEPNRLDVSKWVQYHLRILTECSRELLVEIERFRRD